MVATGTTEVSIGVINSDTSQAYTQISSANTTYNSDVIYSFIFYLPATLGNDLDISIFPFIIPTGKLIQVNVNYFQVFGVESVGTQTTATGAGQGILLNVSPTQADNLLFSAGISTVSESGDQILIIHNYPIDRQLISDSYYTVDTTSAVFQSDGQVLTLVPINAETSISTAGSITIRKFN